MAAGPLRSRTARATLVALCASLYAVIGYLSYLGIFAPAVGVVRFWPAVFVPAVFSIAYGPMVGGLGAAIGIFISDMAIHGNALLSLTVGVPANFIGFYLVGLLYEKAPRHHLALMAAELAAAALIAAGLYLAGLLPLDLALATLASFAVTLAPVPFFKGEDRRMVFAGSTGLMAGSAWIGLGVWLYSQAFTLPNGTRSLPAWAALLWFLWTYITEIPFIAVLTPPVVRALRRAGLSR